MPKLARELSAIEVKRAVEPGRHPVGGVSGLYLWVRESGTKNWLLRTTIKGKRCDVGLGGYPTVTLSQARDTARNLLARVAAGADPLADKRAARAEVMTFRKAGDEYQALHRASWKNEKHAQQWKNTLEQYVYPSIGDLAVKDVQTEHVAAIITPLWNTKNETMVRVRNRIELVIQWAVASGYREPGLNPAAWRGHLDHVLPKPSKVNRRAHHPAMPWSQVPAFMDKLGAVEGSSARCLEFVILTACRSGEARGATWDEIDLGRRVWNIPAERMKAGRAHRVPLSEQAVCLLNQQLRVEGEPLVFFGKKSGAVLSDMSLTMLLRRHAPGVTAHGFRSSFRDWAAETTNYPNEVCEMALAHAVGGAVEAAYRRGDMMQRREGLMADWAHYVRPPVLRTRK